jgi:hypothetical protein
MGLSFTRGALTHAYFPATVGIVTTPGAVRVSQRLNNSNPWTVGIPQVWPIMRPSTAPDPNGAPFYVNGYPQQTIIRGGVAALRLAPNDKEMDPSNPATWQRAYRFT